MRRLYDHLKLNTDGDSAPHCPTDSFDPDRVDMRLLKKCISEAKEEQETI